MNFIRYIETSELETFFGEYNGLGTDYHHGEAEKFRQQMEEASSIPERADQKVTNLKTSFIGIVVAILVISCLFLVGMCFAGRIVVRGCMNRGTTDHSDSSSFAYENERV